MGILPAHTKTWLGRRMLRRVQRKGFDLANLPALPRATTMPLRRAGLDPVPELAHRRETEPVSLLARPFGLNIWLVSGYDEVRAVLADTTRYSNDIRPMMNLGERTDAEGIGGLGFTDPPDHTRLRKYLTPEFTRRRLARLEPRINDIVERQLDLVEAGGPVVDLVGDFAFGIPFQVICELLGLPDVDREQFRALGPARFDLTAGGSGVFGAASQSRQHLFDVVAKQRAAPGDGLIGALLTEHGDAIDDVELGGLADGVFLGGYETSASVLAMGTLVLLQNPAAYELVRTDDAALDSTVEELLRYLSVVQVAFPRFARHDHELFGQQISAGDLLACSLSGANRDAAFGPDADLFDALRPASASHLAFGHGFHRCVGAELARMELRAAFRGLSRRFPDLALAVDPERLEFRKMSAVYGVESLPVRLSGAERLPKVS